MQHWLGILPISATLLAAAMVPGAAVATTTSASASAFSAGTTVRQSFEAGAQGTQASASRIVPSSAGDAFVSAEASSLPGALKAVGTARTSGAPGDFQAQASSSWSDSFVISAPGHTSSDWGFFSGSVAISGELLVAFSGRTYSDSQVFATVDIFPGTGYNGGRTVVSASARNLMGYDIQGTHFGSDNFALVFSNVPFTFNQRIDISLSLSVTADVNAIDAGATGRSEANYAHTMSWAGLSLVRDQADSPLTIYSAMSSESGFNFANATPVPEANRPALTALGLAWLATLVLLRRRSGWRVPMTMS